MNILILLLPKNICYSAERSMEFEFGTALIKKGVSVTYLDTEAFTGKELLDLSSRNFDALFSFETSFYHSYIEDYDIRYGDLFKCPKFYFSLDHPQSLYKLNRNAPDNLYILTHDRNYIKYIKKYYSKISGVFLMSPAGKEVFYNGSKIYDISFMGSFPNDEIFTRKFMALDSHLHYLANAYSNEIAMHPELTDSENFYNICLKNKLYFSDEQFSAIMSKLAFIPDMVMAVYRKNVLLSLLQAGFSINVWGESWNNFPDKENYSLIIHKAVPFNDSITEIAKSKFSINVMSGHKDGYTERISNSALNHAVIISDRSTQLTEKYLSDSEIIFYDFHKLNELPDKIHRAMPIQSDIAEKAYQKSILTDTWEHKASEFIKIIKELSK